MSKFQKVVWYEGMKLDPHHFQQMDRFYQHNLNSRINSVLHNNWGIKSIEIDSSNLTNGNFGLISCKGIMPDGLAFDMPNNDPLPQNRYFEEVFEATREGLSVFLTISNEKVSGRNCILEENSPKSNTRYFLQNFEVLDDNSAENLRTIGVGRPNFQIKFEEESLEDFYSIGICEIVRSSNGGFGLKNDFISPCLSIGSSEQINYYTREILGALTQKSLELADLSSKRKKELTFTDVEILLLQQTVNTFIPVLNNFYNLQYIHPEILYNVLIMMAGQLITYFNNPQIRPTDFKSYNHKMLSAVFKNIYDQIMVLLKIKKQIVSNDLEIPLTAQGESLFVGQLSDEHLNAQFFLIVKSDMPENKIITELPKSIKISAREEIFAVHQAGIQGLTIDFIQRPPKGIQERSDLIYFRINKEGRFWDKIVKKKNIAFFLASEFSKIEIGLTILFPND